MMALGLGLGLAFAGPAGAPAIPAVVTSMGLLTAWNTQTTAGSGVTGPMTKNMANNQAEVAVNAFVDTPNKTIFFSGAASYAYTDFDFTGWEVIVNGNGTWTFTNCKFFLNGLPLLTYTVALGNSGAGTATFSHCTFDCASPTQNRGGVNMDPAWVSATFTDCRFVNGGATTVIADALTTNSFTRCYFGPPGANPTISGHIENLKVNDRTYTCTDCFLDGRASAGAVSHTTGVNGGMTGQFFLSADTANASGTWNTSIISGATTLNSAYAAQANTTGAFTMTLNMTTCAIDVGTSGHIGSTAGGGGTCNITCTGCKDLGTGVAIAANGA